MFLQCDDPEAISPLDTGGVSDGVCTGELIEIELQTETGIEAVQVRIALCPGVSMSI